ncbi:hypothetical protein [Granulicella mallensis]|uniref:Uncharacterized protein n=1 Tax=Granulicella mallensis (strain ATCC BAA-1857 / DSM 23137 / MP5ACTX8) TaxID=682795 RepID=G8NZR2_GRAMM|nr:hypothetical protein [Granulicella mallensis]AEU34539.1 hypothetical protein AciX8_0181 [Granulicella mallensis MP5ACTX8]
MHTEGHDAGRPEGTTPHPPHQRDSEHPGYEVQDVNAGGIATFLAGLFGTVLIFFVFCFFMGKAINTMMVTHDEKPNKWQADLSQPGATPRGNKREDLTSAAEMQQRQLQSMTQAFPTPRLETDDGNQDVADLHAREDLLLDHYSSSTDLPQGAVRIPIDRAMQLVVQRGLGAAPAAQTPQAVMAGESAPAVQAPLTDGFARTGYELETIQARNEKNDFNRAEAKKD